MRQEFQGTLQLDADAPTVWRTVSDLPTVLSWISVIEQVEESGGGYSVVLADKLGPFKLRADVAITVLEQVEGKLIRAHGEGEDRQIGSRLIIDVSMALEEHDGGTRVDVDGSYEVTGRPAALGAGSIRKKANAILSEFFTSAQEAAGTAAST